MIPRAIANAKKVALTAEAAALHKQQALQEEELRLRRQELEHQQQQEEAKLRLNQRKQHLQLETEIAKMEAEERAYAMAELGDQYFQLPTYGRTQDHATSYDKAFAPIQAPNGRPKKGTTTDSLLDAKPSTASPDAPVWPYKTASAQQLQCGR